MSNRYAQTSRVFTILGLLEGAPHGLTVSDVHSRVRDEFQVDKRTVYRDLQALESLGFLAYPDEGEAGEGRRWKLQRTLKVGQALNLEYRELLALYIARHSLMPLKDTPFYTDLEKVFKRIESVLGPAAKSYLQELSGEVRFESGPRWGLGIDPTVLEAVQASCEERHVLSVVYDSVNSSTQRRRRLGPQFLYFAKGALYLVAEDLEKGEIKTFALPRMKDATMESDSYDAERVDPGKFFEHSFGIFRGQDPVEIVLEFGRAWSRPIQERAWHSSQKVQARKDGTAQMTLKVAITPELVSWVLGFGEGARVVKPAQLRDELLKAAKSVVDLYGKKKVA